MRRLALIAILIAACQAEAPIIDRPEPLQSGSAFLTEETLTLQKDEFANPAMIWVERGAALFESEGCVSCHKPGEDWESAAARYPAVELQSGEVLNLEGRINMCRTERLNQSEWDYESEELLSVTTFITHQAKGQTISIDIDHPKMKSAIKRGQDYYFTRRGQMNFSCAMCHDDHWGTKLRGDTISQGHPDGFPAYRFEWQEVGSLHRRLADCDRGVRAEPHALGSQQYLDLEVYLAARAQGLEIETPAVRR